MKNLYTDRMTTQSMMNAENCVMHYIKWHID